MPITLDPQTILKCRRVSCGWRAS